MSPAPLQQRFQSLFTALLVAIGERHRVLPAWAVGILHKRLARLGKHVAELLRKLAAGTYRAPRPRTPSQAPRAAKPQAIPSLGIRGALLELAPLAGARADVLRELLADPGLEAHVHAAPALGRHLRRLCRLLMVEPPDFLRAPARPPHARRPRAQPTPRPPADLRAPCWRKLMNACRADRLARHFASSPDRPDLMLHAFRDFLTPEIRRLLAPRFRWIPADP